MDGYEMSLSAEQTKRYDVDGNEIIDLMTCGHCGRTWNDAAISAYTPTPSARCPFEFAHEYDAEGCGVEEL